MTYLSTESLQGAMATGCGGGSGCWCTEDCVHLHDVLAPPTSPTRWGWDALALAAVPRSGRTNSSG